jgi:kynureninase
MLPGMTGQQRPTHNMANIDPAVLNAFLDMKSQNSKAPWVTLDERFAPVVYAESAGGSPQEIAATATTFLNLAKQLGYEKALRRSSAYLKKSPQYLKASNADFSPYEKKVWKNLNEVVNFVASNQDKLPAYLAFENINAFGTPRWAKDFSSFKDIGRQRYYIK